MISCQQTQNVIDGKKRIILNPNETQKRDFETATFAEDEVYGIDILMSSGEDGKVIHPPAHGFHNSETETDVYRLVSKIHERRSIRRKALSLTSSR
jgi:hypothetical protein